MRTIDEKRATIVKEMALEGGSRRAIAAAAGVAKNTVSRHQHIVIESMRSYMDTSRFMLDLTALKECGPAFMGDTRFNNRRWTEAEHANLKTLCQGRVDVEKAASILGRSPKSIAWRASDHGLGPSPEWRALLSGRKGLGGQRIQLAYPYIIRARDEHADLLAVNSIVPAYMPGREDVCQEVMLALWEKRITLDQLRANSKNLRPFIRQFSAANYENGGYALSLDQPMYDGRSWHDVLADPNTLPD